MRIHFKKIRYKNFLSTGNLFTEIELDRTNTTLISGSNGSGKSTFLDAIIFSLFGKPHRKINKPQLTNTINNKDLLVEIEFQISQNLYMIRRGLKPAIFEIYKNGELLNQDSAKRDYQEYLEQEILGINYKSFNQIVVLGSATYIPFMELSAAARRQIIEDMLDIQVFSTMNVLLKDKISENKTTINETTRDIEFLKSKIDSVKEHNEEIKRLRDTEVDKIRENMKENIEKIESEKSKIDSIQQDIEDLISEISDKSKIKSKLEKTKDIRRELESKLNNHKTDLTFYHDHNNCPTCRQGIDHDFKQSIIKEKNEKSDELSEGILKIKEKISECESRINEISLVEDKIQKKNLEIGEFKAQIKISKNILLSSKKELETARNSANTIDKSKLDDYNQQLKTLETEQSELAHKRDIMSVVSNMLKDGGIKTRIIRQYIPIMNKLINSYLSAFELFVDFHLDESFNEVIKSRFRDTFSYASFSEGEKLRISLSIMLAWRAVAKMRNSTSTNILLLDETLDGALDGVGIENLIDTLHNLNNNDNIFVISHRGEMFQDKFQSHIKFEKVKNFSQISG